MSEPWSDGPERVSGVEVVVVGSGPVGATAANLLGLAGIDVLVLEKGYEPLDIPRAIHFDASIMRIFQSIGLSDEMLAQTRLIEQMETYGAEGQLLAASGSGTGEDGWGAHYNFYQPKLEQTLLDALDRFPTVKVRMGAEVIAVEPQPDDDADVRWQELGQVKVVRANYVIAADGASSAVRKMLEIGLDDLDFDEPWVVIDALVSDGHALPLATSQMFCDPQRPTTLVPGPGSHRRWEFMLLDGEEANAMTSSETVAGLLAPYVDPKLVEVIRASVYRFHALIAHTWQRGRIFLAGDAAHQTPPFLGQGMCHGIRDAQALAWRIRAVKSGASSAVLDSYQKEREPQVREVIQKAVLKGREICILDPAKARERDEMVAARSKWSTALDSTLIFSVDHGVVHPSRQRGVRALPQTLASGELLDDALPASFLIVSAVPASDTNLKRVEAVDSLVHDLPAFAVQSPAVSGWLAQYGAQWAIIRPDRHPYAFASDESSLVERAAHLRNVLIDS